MGKRMRMNEDGEGDDDGQADQPLDDCLAEFERKQLLKHMKRSERPGPE